ncbi:MAG: dTDP-4-dehydrorhamnose reductase, partial [Verrucomicrobia bacterium]|nr:dTDP-4-dehydrorhamnose reductase [Verrucomicrobiota bacterium]
HATALAEVSLTASTIADLDITDAAGVEAAFALRPDWVINCAGWTRVDDAEEHEAEATRINGEAVGIIGRAATAVGARVLHISTDYVFDGRLGRPYREDDRPNPESAYGRSKLAGERALATVDGGRWTVVRTQWLYGGGPSFVRTMWRKAKAGERARVVDDQFGAPTHVSELAQAIWRLVREDARGIWHAAASGYTNWYEVARLVYAGAGADPGLVTPCSTEEFNAKAPRPADGRLDTSKLGAMRRFDEVLVEALGAAGSTPP